MSEGQKLQSEKGDMFARLQSNNEYMKRNFSGGERSLYAQEIFQRIREPLKLSQSLFYVAGQTFRLSYRNKNHTHSSVIKTAWKFRFISYAEW